MFSDGVTYGSDLTTNTHHCCSCTHVYSITITVGVGDGSHKYLHVQQVKLEKVIILIAFFCKVALLCNITARRVEKLCCAFYHSHVQAAVLQQFRLLQVARILVFDWLRVSWSHTKHRLTSPEDATCYKPSLSLAGKARNIFRFCSKK